MNRRGFLGLLTAVLGGAAAAGKIARGSNGVEPDSEARPPATLPADPENPQLPPEDWPVGADVYGRIPDPENAGSPLNLPGGGLPMPQAPSAEEVEDCMREVNAHMTDWYERQVNRILAEKSYVLEESYKAFGLKPIGITCPKCGVIGGPNCPCGWEYNSMFTGGMSPVNMGEVKRTVGMVSPLGALPEERFFPPRFKHIMPMNVVERRRDKNGCNVWIVVGHPIREAIEEMVGVTRDYRTDVRVDIHGIILNVFRGDSEGDALRRYDWLQKYDKCT